ncbi:MAG: TetR/AcrR family transcriptional regulator [Oceanospirillales bacterium]|nr:TetR/AcrR family transcriptional regulator [Oceanospirillales bacterium]
MPYTKPIQKRARETEAKFLDALDSILNEQSFSDTTIEQIAERANLTKSAFLRRFGTKDQALFVLFGFYADAASALIQQVLKRLHDPEDMISLIDVLFFASSEFDLLLQKHFSANRAMYEYFKKDLRSHPFTLKIFGECIEMMKAIQQRYFEASGTEMGANAAAQLLVTIDFNYSMRAMPALPDLPAQRHLLIAEIVALTLNR